MARNISERVKGALELYNGTPIKTKPLCAYLQITPRELQIAIRDLRLQGVKVCSGNGGYWLWDGQDDSWAHTKSQIKSRAIKLNILVAAMDRTGIDGQESWL